MQIPTNFSAAQAISIASQVSARDKDAALQSGQLAETTPLPATLEQTQGASADRDAQGQGDGLGSHARQRRDENDVATELKQDESVDTQIARGNEDEPPSLIDLVC